MNTDRGLWLAMLVGVAAFLGLTRGAILDPRRTDWLLWHPDPATSFVGWHFFRHSPALQFPLGANPGYGMELGSSVVVSDSIPLLALLLKPFSSVLPATFQYFGLWVLLSLVLQSALAYKLLRRFSEDRRLALIGSAFFALAPILVFRLQGHFALAGQWVVLAGLYLYFAPRFSPGLWTLLLSLGALIHFYFLVMLGVLWAAGDLWQRRWCREITALQAAMYLSSGVFAAALVMWLAGYFMIGNAAAAWTGFGVFRMNLLALIDPEDLWSLVLPDVPGPAHGSEGFNYLGLGMLLLAPLAGYGLLRRARQFPIDHRRLVPLLLVSLGFSLLALSNRVALGNVELVAYEVPDVLKAFTDLLRSSGRMFWPVYYLAYLAILVAVFRTCTARVALAACAAMLALQTVDSSAALRRLSNLLAHPAPWSSPLKSPLWSEIGKRYKHVVYVLPRNAPETFLPWALFAAGHGMTVNFGYFARVNADSLIEARKNVEQAVLGDALDPQSLYVFESEPLWRMRAAGKGASDVAGVLDGFRIIAPGLRECAACDLRALADVR